MAVPPPQAVQTAEGAGRKCLTAVLWDIAGSDLGGGVNRFAVDAKTREKRSLAADIQFGSRVLSAPDLNGDGVGEIITVARSPNSDKARPAVLVFSGSDGKLLADLAPSESQGWPHEGAQTVLLDSATTDRRPGVAVSGRTRDGHAMVAVFVLDRLR